MNFRLLIYGILVLLLAFACKEETRYILDDGDEYLLRDSLLGTWDGMRYHYCLNESETDTFNIWRPKEYLLTFRIDTAIIDQDTIEWFLDKEERSLSLFYYHRDTFIFALSDIDSYSIDTLTDEKLHIVDVSPKNFTRYPNSKCYTIIHGVR